jgi:hypothetical protein
MVTFLITSLVILGFLGLAIYYWQKPTRQTDVELLAPPRENRALFAEVEPLAEESTVDNAKQCDAILERAQAGEFSALNDAFASKTSELYKQVVDALLKDANDSKVTSLASYISRNNLAVTVKFAERFQLLWEAAPNRQSTAKMLHVSALADDAATFTHAVEAVLKSSRNKALSDITTKELYSLITGEYWLLSSSQRNSGAGFVLKQTISKAKKDLTNS